MKRSISKKTPQKAGGKTGRTTTKPRAKSLSNSSNQSQRKKSIAPTGAIASSNVGLTVSDNPGVELSENNLLFLIGAGCSVTAGIKMANQMVDDIERFVKEKKDWQPFSDLYYYIKSAILYGDGITGSFTNALNVERLVLVLTELGKKEQNLVYPFIGNWNTRLMEVAGSGFTQIKAFQERIKMQLFEWINIGDFTEAEYYTGFSRFKKEFGYPIRIFSFNYDLCIEEVIKDLNIELGFDQKTKEWLYSNFDPNEDRDIDIYLYKLHGSIDWERATEKGNVLVKRTHPKQESELIFGTEAKLTSTDPYLYDVFEFRKYSLHEGCKLLIVIGYSFGDDYMNKLISQALSASQQRNVLIIDLNPEPLKQAFVKRYGVDEKQVKMWKGSADVFLKTELSLTFLNPYLPTSTETPF